MVEPSFDAIDDGHLMLYVVGVDLALVLLCLLVSCLENFALILFMIIITLCIV